MEYLSFILSWIIPSHEIKKYEYFVGDWVFDSQDYDERNFGPLSIKQRDWFKNQ